MPPHPAGHHCCVTLAVVSAVVTANVAVAVAVDPAAVLPRLHHVEPEFAGAHDGDGNGERDHEIENPEYQQRRQQLLLAELWQRDQHCRVEHAEASRRMAGEAEQGGQNENDRHRHEINVRMRGHQQIHCQCAESEIDDSDQDLHEGQRRRRQHDLPAVLPEFAAVATGDDPGEIDRDAGEAAECDQAVD